MKTIWVTFQKEGIHKYPAALDDPKLATGDEYDVSFLGYPHRHIFHFKVWIEIFHDDRDIEFIQFKRWLEKLYAEKTVHVGGSYTDLVNDLVKEPNLMQYVVTMKDLEGEGLNLEGALKFYRFNFT